MIIVFGSINMDVVTDVKTFPRPGETVLSPAYDMGPGGKGANQALAAARGGAKTAIVGKVGDDGMGTRILTHLRRNEVMTSGVAVSEDLPTGMAFVIRDARGENQIIVASGANSEAAAAQVPDEILLPGNIVLFQMEVPLQENFMLLERARAHGATTILNLAPAFRISEKALDLVDILIVNEHEALLLAEGTAHAGHPDPVVVAKALAQIGRLTCIITLGDKGAVAVQADGSGWRVPALEIERVVDTTGAGDCFCGTFAAALHAGQAVPEALRRASVAAGLSCTKKGAQDSYPLSGDIDDALKAFPAPKIL